MNKNLLLLVLLCLTTSDAYGQWVVETRTDSMTDKVIVEASTRGESGHILKVVRPEPEGPVVGIFRVAEDSSDILDSEKLGMLRVDAHDPVDLSLYASLLGGEFASAEPKWLTFRIWQGEDTHAPSGSLLRDLMEGESLVLRYYLASGGYKEERFELTGAKQAIAEATGVSADISEEQAKQDEAKRQDRDAFQNAYLTCLELKGRKARKCSEEVLACNTLEGEVLLKCLEEATSK